MLLSDKLLVRREMIFKDLNLEREDGKYLLILFILIALCFAKYIEFVNSGAILNVDSALYLISSLKYAGMDYYNIVNPRDLYFSPIISFLTSILFRLGLVDKLAISIVSMTISFAGYFALYILLKNRFNSLLSFTGVIIFGCLSVVIFNMPQGMIDLPAVAISMWALVFAVAAIDKNPKYFLIAFPLLVIAFFTKYVAGFMLPIIFLYYLMKRNFIDNVDCLFYDAGSVKDKLSTYLKSKEFKYILISAAISAILAAIICKTLILDYGGPLTFFKQSVNTFNGHKVGHYRVYFPQKSHYVRDFPTILFENRRFRLIYAYALYGFFGLGFVIFLINVLKNRNCIKLNKESFKTKHFNKLLVILLIAFVVVSFVGFKYLSNNMVANISILIAITILFSILQKYNINESKTSYDILMISYFLVYFIFLSLYDLKVRRYALPFIPPFIYMVIWGLNNIMDFLTKGFDDAKSFKDNLFKADNEKNYSKLANLIPIFVVCVLVITTAVFLAPQEIDESNYDFHAVHYQGFINDLRDVCDFIKEYDPDYHSKSFASFSASSRPVKWYLKVNVTIVNGEVPEFKQFDNSTYLIINRNATLKNYHELYNKGDFTVYEHN